MAAAAPRARLVLLRDDPECRVARIHREYVIEQDDGPAFALHAEEWLPVALEVGGVRVPFTVGEKLHLRVFDERDPEEGVALLAQYVSNAPWKKSGVHYFRGLEWRGVGTYRVAFRLPAARAGLTVEGLDFFVRVRDPGASRAARGRARRLAQRRAPRSPTLTPPLSALRPRIRGGARGGGVCRV